MIIDVHSHTFTYPDHFDDTFRRQASRAHSGEVDLTVHYDHYRANCPDDTVTIVFGGKARLSGLWVDDSYVANYVAHDPDRMIGFCAVDPTQPGWEDELRYGHRELGLRGVKIMPMYAGFDPRDPSLEPLWDYATRNGLPVLSHTGTTFVAQAPLEYAFPRHFDPVATRHPDLRLVLAHLGHPFENECIAVIRKHPNVYADISALHYRPFQLWHTLRLVQDYGVWDKLLFGSDYPFTTIDASLTGLRALTHIPPPDGLPPLDSDALEQVIHRPTLNLLGLTT